jgi:hypothetical protein
MRYLHHAPSLKSITALLCCDVSPAASQKCLSHLVAMCHDRFRLSNVIDVLIWSIVRFEIEQNTYFTVDSLYTIHNLQFTVAYGITKEWNDALKNTDPRSDACYTLLYSSQLPQLHQLLHCSIVHLQVLDESSTSNISSTTRTNRRYSDGTLHRSAKFECY